MFLIVSSAAALHYLRSEAPTQILVVHDLQIKDRLKKGYADLAQISASSAGLGIGISIATLVSEFVVVILRFLNIGLINYKFKTFLTIVHTKKELLNKRTFLCTLTIKSLKKH